MSFFPPLSLFLSFFIYSKHMVGRFGLTRDEIAEYQVVLKGGPMTERCDAMLDSQLGACARRGMYLIADQLEPQGYITLHSGIPYHLRVIGWRLLRQGIDGVCVVNACISGHNLHQYIFPSTSRYFNLQMEHDLIKRLNSLFPPCPILTHQHLDLGT